jgi:hypothetical protein
LSDLRLNKILQFIPCRHGFLAFAYLCRFANEPAIPKSKRVAVNIKVV